MIKVKERKKDFILPYLRVYKPHFLTRICPPKIGVRLIHGILCPFDD
jgi:hypothetical protein